jgi:tRNA dimethylallyltransferase
LDEIYSRWKVPILCWGTWLYIDSLIYDFNIPKIPADEKLRKSLEKEAEKYWNKYVWEKLKEIDPEYAKELHYNNIRYIIRAIEVKMITWKSKTEFREEKTLKYDTLFLTPYNGDREYLYNRINKRVWMMFDDWLVREVKELLKKYNKNDFWMKTIWYKEVIEYFENKDKIDKKIVWEKWKKLSLWEKVKRGIALDLDETIELVKKNNRNYAKTQLTWFRKYKWDNF